MRYGVLGLGFGLMLICGLVGVVSDELGCRWDV